jgi:hypothetical protein
MSLVAVDCVLALKQCGLIILRPFPDQCIADISQQPRALNNHALKPSDTSDCAAHRILINDTLLFEVLVSNSIPLAVSNT